MDQQESDHQPPMTYKYKPIEKFFKKEQSTINKDGNGNLANDPSNERTTC